MWKNWGSQDDGSARLDVDGGPIGRTRYSTKLGQTSAAAGGSASLVSPQEQPAGTRDYPNHQMIIDLQVSERNARSPCATC